MRYSSAVFLVVFSADALAEDSSAGALPEVVVTAERRAQDIQDVPVSVSVVSATDLEQFHATQLADLEGYVAGLQINSAGSPGQTQISIRGIAPLSGGGATVGTYIGDIPVGSTPLYERGAQYAVDLLPYDVERIEVLKGPQGTLYGAGAVGGVLKYVLTSPDLSRFEGRLGGNVSAIAGAANLSGGARAMINGPLIPNELGITASYAVEHTAGYIDNALTQQPGENADQQESGRLGFLWHPGSTVDVRLGALFQRIRSRGNTEVALNPVTFKPLLGPRQDNNYVGQPFEGELQLYDLSVDWDLGWSHLLSATGFSDHSSRLVTDTTRFYGPLFPLLGFPAGISTFGLTLDTRKFTQEFRLSSPTGIPVEWLAGAFYTHERNGNSQIVTAQDFSGAPLVGLDPPALAFSHYGYSEYAAYGTLTYHLNSRWSLSAGLRWAEDQQSKAVASSGAFVGDSSSTFAEATGSAWTYSVAPRVRISANVMAYARIASGYEAGAPNVPLPGVPPKVDPDRLTSYEIGVKSVFWNHRATVDLTAFDLQWRNIQVSGSTPSGVGYLTNGGTARSRGFEGNVGLQPLDRLVINLNAAFTDARITQDIPSVGGLSGDRLPFIPRWSASLRASYTQPISAGWNGHLVVGVRFVTDRYATGPFTLDTFEVHGYHAVDLRADVANKLWKVGLFATNVGNTRAYSTYNPIVNLATGEITQVEGLLIEPRTVGLTIDRVL